jgi:hypothetical protein
MWMALGSYGLEVVDNPLQEAGNQLLALEAYSPPAAEHMWWTYGKQDE